MSSSHDIERDRALVFKAQQSPETFGLIFDLYYSTILSYVLKRVGDAEAAEDITAQVFLKAFKNIKRFSWRGAPLSAWLYRIAGNEIKMHFRRPRKTVSLELLAEAGFDRASELQEERDLLQELVERDQEFARAAVALRAMPLRYQEAVTLRYIEEKEFNEIALILNCREGTARSLVSRGLTKLRELMSASVQQKGTERIIGTEGRSVLSTIK